MKLVNLHKSFEKQKVLEGYNLEIKQTGITKIEGPSGSGKTTILRIISGLETADQGEFVDIPKNISFMFQEDRLFPWYSAVKNIEIATKKTEKEILNVLSKLGISNTTAVKLPSELSGGEKRRVALVRTLLKDAELYILDEPYTGLDDETKKLAENLIKELAKTKPILLVSHG
ncbi:MAG: ABC transporter ATP-binding protein [Ruminococcaceae bacterium]|nr:ABC transporter ATP-binding protein [Oscillospiraceae bacterium]